MPTLADFAARRGITFPMLSDPGSAVIKSYGLLNTTVPESNKTQYGIPFPGTFFVDRQGKVTSRFFETAYQERSTITSMMVRLGNNVAAPATKVSASHVQMTTYVTDQVVAPGTHFSVVLEGKPENRVHVYAPGVTGYKPLSLTIQPQPGLVVRAAQFPRSEDYFFKPLNEHVPVYQKPFRIVQDLTIDQAVQTQPAFAAGTVITINAVLEYQACDDKVCFLPQSIPLSWQVTMRALDRERTTPQQR